MIYIFGLFFFTFGINIHSHDSFERHLIYDMLSESILLQQCSSIFKIGVSKLFLYYVVCVILCILLPMHMTYCSPPPPPLWSDHKLKTMTYFTSQCSERISIFNLGSSTSKKNKEKVKI